MAKTEQTRTRYVKQCFWTDNYIEDLSVNEKFLFLYLITNPLCNVAGAYEIKLKRIAYETGISTSEIETILGKFEQDKKAVYIDGWMFVVNFAKNQSKSDSIKIGSQRIFATIPENVIQSEKFEMVVRAWDTVYTGWGVGVPTVYTHWGDTLLYSTLPNSTKLNSTLLHSTQPNASAGSAPKEDVLKIFRMFKKLSPKLQGTETDETEACENIIREYPDDWENIASIAVSVQGKKYAPKILTPKQLWEKIGDLQVFLKRQNNQETKGIRL